jgi:hypothetical protein
LGGDRLPFNQAFNAMVDKVIALTKKMPIESGLKVQSAEERSAAVKESGI